jgi:hypothetical protein
VRLFTDQQVKSFGSLAQLVEQLAFNQLVARSSRARPTIFSFGIPKAYRNVSLFLRLQFLSFWPCAQFVPKSCLICAHLVFFLFKH